MKITLNDGNFLKEAKSPLIFYTKKTKFTYFKGDERSNIESAVKGKNNFGTIQSIPFKKSKLTLVSIDKENISSEDIRNLSGIIIGHMEAENLSNVEIATYFLEKIKNEEFIPPLVEGVILSSYKFDKYLSKKSEKGKMKIELFVKEADMDYLKGLISENITIANCTNDARNLVNEPGNIMTPSTIASFAKEYGKKYGFEVEVLNKKEIEKLNMGAYLSVAKGSDEEPKFIIMRYKKGKNKETVGFVGKGVTFDTGGLSLKPAQAMLGMKFDMAGGAAVIGAMGAIAQQKLKVNVVAVVAACENGVSGSAYRPDDVVISMSGKSIEVLNTDAEGRLTMADAIHYIKEHEGATKIVDIATLTGAVIACLGNLISGAVSNDDKFFNELLEASKKSGEEFWRLPNREEYKALLKSDIADIANINYRGGAGAITAGMFLETFVGKIPWIHLDIAGTADSKANKKYLRKGATGVGVRTLYRMVKANN